MSIFRRSRVVVVSQSNRFNNSITCDVTAVLRVNDDGDVLTKRTGRSLHFTFAGVELAVRTTQLSGTVLKHTQISHAASSIFSLNCIS